MFTISNVKTFKDSVHGYIDVPKCFVENLMDNEYFQRLRNIEQTGMRVLYPNAKHDRFSHSLGVFHLGLRAVDALLENFSKDQYWNIESDNQSILYWAKNKVLFLIACLLHDIGHAPFSHALESQVLNNSKKQNKNSKNGCNNETGDTAYVTAKLYATITDYEEAYMSYKYNDDSAISKLDISKVAPHEQIGSLLIFNEFFRSRIVDIFNNLHESGFPRPEGESILYSEYYKDKVVIDKINFDDENSRVVFEDDLCFIARMIMGLKYDDWRPERQIRNCFIELLNGQNFDVDKLDYIVRDTQMSGINNISLDVDRLVKSLCIITKTKHLNKLDLSNKKIEQTTIVNIENKKENNELYIDGKYHGTLIIKKNAEVIIKKNSKIESFTSIVNGEAKISYKNANRAKFDCEAIVTQDSDIISTEDSGKNDGKKIIQLLGKSSSRTFYTSIRNATVVDDFNFIASEDIRLTIHENCIMTIKGLFYSEKPIRLFRVNDIRGDISEVEILDDTFKQKFTKTKVPGKDGYNTFSIGFKKQAINVIANVMDARNYLYLWIYSHHKVIYYANFLIPVLAKELVANQVDDSFPNWKLDLQNIINLDDAYVWTVFRYWHCFKKWKQNIKDNELKQLLNEFFTRRYKKSLYKSLAEYDLFFEKYDYNTKVKLREYINTSLLSVGETTKPYIEISGKSKKQYSVGYFNKNQIVIINKKINELSKVEEKYLDIKLTELVYVSVDYKMKQLETLNTFIDMKEDIIPISQIPLLETQTKKSVSGGDKAYFYLYYQTNIYNNHEKEESGLIKKAIKNYFDELIETKIK